MTKVSLMVDTTDSAYIEKIMATPFENRGGYVA